MSAAMENMIPVQMMENMITGGWMSLAPRADEMEPRVIGTSWSAGECAIPAVNLQIVAERLIEALELRENEDVLDLGAGSGNIALSAGRRRCRVVSIIPLVSSDHLDASIERDRAAAAAENLAVDYWRGKAAALPVGDDSFDVVASSFSAMFEADRETVSEELMRACRPGGRIGLTTWAPESFLDQLFATIERHVPLSPETGSPFTWGEKEELTEQFGIHAQSIDVRPRKIVLRFDSPKHWLETWKSAFAPLRRALEGIDPWARDQLIVDLLAFIDRANDATDGTVALRADYLEVVIRKRGRKDHENDA